MNKLTQQEQQILYAVRSGCALTTGKNATVCLSDNIVWIHPLIVDGFPTAVCALSSFTSDGFYQVINDNYLDSTTLVKCFAQWLEQVLVPRFNRAALLRSGPLQLGFASPESLVEFRTRFRELEAIRQQSVNKRFEAPWTDEQIQAYQWVLSVLIEHTTRFDSSVVVLTTQLQELFITGLAPAYRQNLMAWNDQIHGRPMEPEKLAAFRSLKPDASHDKPMYKLAKEVFKRSFKSRKRLAKGPVLSISAAIAGPRKALSLLIKQACQTQLDMMQELIGVFNEFDCTAKARREYAELELEQLRFFDTHGRYSKTSFVRQDSAQCALLYTQRIHQQLKDNFESLQSDPGVFAEHLAQKQILEVDLVFSARAEKNAQYLQSCQEQVVTASVLQMAVRCTTTAWEEFLTKDNAWLQLHCIDMQAPSYSSDSSWVQARPVANDELGRQVLLLKFDKLCPALKDKLNKGQFDHPGAPDRYRWLLSTVCEKEIAQAHLNVRLKQAASRRSSQKLGNQNHQLTPPNDPSASVSAVDTATIDGASLALEHDIEIREGK